MIDNCTDNRTKYNPIVKSKIQWYFHIISDFFFFHLVSPDQSVVVLHYLLISFINDLIDEVLLVSVPRQQAATQVWFYKGRNILTTPCGELVQCGLKWDVTVAAHQATVGRPTVRGFIYADVGVSWLFDLGVPLDPAWLQEKLVGRFQSLHRTGGSSRRNAVEEERRAGRLPWTQINPVAACEPHCLWRPFLRFNPLSLSCVATSIVFPSVFWRGRPPTFHSAPQTQAFFGVFLLRIVFSYLSSVCF